jgi:hypothetical protein
MREGSARDPGDGSIAESEAEMKAKLCVAIGGLLLVPALVQAQEACPVATYEAESMFHSTGGAAPGGWNIWSNGYISANHNFDGGSKVVTVFARGQAAAGVFPHMNVTVGGVFIYSYSVTNVGADYRAYTFNLDELAGTKEIRIEFDNDLNQNGQDRNLFIDKVTVGCGGGWTNLTLRNGWRAAANSNTPAVGLIDGIVTFRGALDGTDATSGTMFCLSDGHVSPGPDYTQYRPSDVGWATFRAALANGAAGALTLSIGFKQFDPNLPDTELEGANHCMQVSQAGAGFEIGEDAQELTSLEGVTFTKSAFAPGQNAIRLESNDWGVNYPERGTDGSLPAGEGAYVKLVNGFVRFQGSLVGGGGAPLPKLFTLPAGQGLIPNNPVVVPITLSPLGDTAPGRIVIQTNGDVFVEGSTDAALGGIALDGAAYSISSPASAVAIPLSSGWIASTPRAVRSRLVNGVVRLEGMVKNGQSTTIGTLPTGQRPAKAILVVADAPVLDRHSTLRINTNGAIEIIYPSLLESQVGISLDGVSFAVDASTFQCTGTCLSATPIARNQNSGAFGTTGERWFVVNTNINGWQASETAGRTIRVNGVVMTSGQMPLPPAVNGSYYFQFTAGSNNWSTWSFW